jgi:hypothetical protein
VSSVCVCVCVCVCARARACVFAALSLDAATSLWSKIVSKAIPVTYRGGLLGCKMLRIPHCLDNRLTDGVKFVSPTCRPLLYSPETLFYAFRTHFC